MSSLRLLLVALCALLAPLPAYACGGFFCSSSPVDQNAEKIIFSVDEDKQTTDMIVQIAYQGDDDAFAWLLPVGSVPQNREVFPALALSSFDAQTSPLFQLPEECQSFFDNDGVRLQDAAVSRSASASGDAGVIVHVMETVDVYDVVVIESASADASFQWLIDNGYRLSTVMKPYIELYTTLGMKFLALKLTSDATAKDLKPFKMTLPGITPTVPLRLTAIAAEPEMAIAVWILGQRRFEPANSEEIEIPKDALRWTPNTFPLRTNWANLVARYVDALGGRGWVVEMAGSSADLRTAVDSSFTSTDDQMKARSALLALLKDRPYLTRLYTRVAAEEMSYDPVFKQSNKPDVARVHELPFVKELCGEDPAIDPCEFSACGTLGLCRQLGGDLADAGIYARQRTGCACAPGSSARTTFDPTGQAVIACQDQRMSFMNPGDIDAKGAKLPDPCVGFSCGEFGTCVAMNLTPTCECEQGYVAVASLDAGKRQTRCVKPRIAVPKSFYNRRPPPLAPGIVAGRTLALAPATGKPDVELPSMYGSAASTPTLDPAAPKQSSDCAAASANDHGVWFWLLALLMLRRRRSSV